jgi:16S rRNA processing protein RimM
MEEKKFLPIGKIIGAHGVKGALKVYSYAESFSIFKPGIRIHLKNTNTTEKTYLIRWAKPYKRILRLCLQGISTRDQAESLVGSEMFIERAKLPRLDNGTYYWADIIGLSVFTKNGRYLGRVESIIPTGSNDVYVVKDTKVDSSTEILIPALEAVVMAIDVEHKIMHVDLPEGL